MKNLLLLIFLSLSLTITAKDGKIKYGKIIYQGEVKNGEPSGFGKLMYKTHKGMETVLWSESFNGKLVYNAAISMECGDKNGFLRGDLEFFPEDKKTDVLIRIRVFKGKLAISQIHEFNICSKVDIYVKERNGQLTMLFSEDSFQYDMYVNKNGIKDVYGRMFFQKENQRLMIDTDSVELNDGTTMYPLNEEHTQWRRYYKTGDYDDNVWESDWVSFPPIKTQNIHRTINNPDCVFEAMIGNNDKKETDGSLYSDGIVTYKNGDVFKGIVYYSLDSYGNNKIELVTGVCTKKNGEEETWKDRVNLTQFDLDLKTKIRENYLDPGLTRLMSNMYAEQVKEQVAFQGQPCWREAVYMVKFQEGNTLVIANGFRMVSVYNNRILYETPVSTQQIKYILVNNDIYSWSYPDYSDLKKYATFDSRNNIIKLEGSNKVLKKYVE